jgi:4-amino-4-deoxy-L-arabinose transferase-like glycosyltransferase
MSLYSSFGIAGPYLWGHFGYHGATYVLRARMTLRFHLLTPATWPGFVVPPLPQSFYFHHPIGYHHILVPFLWLFGDHEWVARAVAAGGGLLCLGGSVRADEAALWCARWSAGCRCVCRTADRRFV